MDPEVEKLKMRIRTLKPLEYYQKKLRIPSRLSESYNTTNGRSKKQQHFYSLLPPSTAMLNEAMPELSDIVNGPQSMPKKNKFKSALSRFFNVGRNKKKLTEKRKKLTVDDIIINTDSILLMKNSKDLEGYKQQQQQNQKHIQQMKVSSKQLNVSNGPHSQLLDIIHSDDNFKIAMDITTTNTTNNKTVARDFQEPTKYNIPNDNSGGGGVIEENIYQNTMERKISALNFINATAPSATSSMLIAKYDFPPLPPIPVISGDDDGDGGGGSDSITTDYEMVANLIYDNPLDDNNDNADQNIKTDHAIGNNNSGGSNNNDISIYDDNIYEEIFTPNRQSFGYSDSTFDSATDDNETDDI
ncbi:putative protein 1 [Mauternbach virus]|uniref:Uncharacterized protein n=1 Tax=Mauternbach virus TaxID=2486603 RepID=A0A3G3E887_9VIRU|nr:putative protein 1 [Mauternbach virus]AYP97934.1 putative protein 1 [Mauternbach virus]